MKKQRVTKLNYKLTEDLMERVDNVSMSVRGESLTIRELFERHRQGQSLGGALIRNGLYDEKPDFDFEDITARPEFDLADAAEFNTEMQNKLEKLEQAKLRLKEFEKKHLEKLHKERTEGELEQGRNKQGSSEANDERKPGRSDSQSAADKVTK